MPLKKLRSKYNVVLVNEEMDALLNGFKNTLWKRAQFKCGSVPFICVPYLLTQPLSIHAKHSSLHVANGRPLKWHSTSWFMIQEALTNTSKQTPKPLSKQKDNIQVWLCMLRRAGARISLKGKKTPELHASVCTRLCDRLKHSWRKWWWLCVWLFFISLKFLVVFIHQTLKGSNLSPLLYLSISGSLLSKPKRFTSWIHRFIFKLCSSFHIPRFCLKVGINELWETSVQKQINPNYNKLLF